MKRVGERQEFDKYKFYHKYLKNYKIHYYNIIKIKLKIKNNFIKKKIVQKIIIFSRFFSYTKVNQLNIVIQTIQSKKIKNKKLNNYANKYQNIFKIKIKIIH